jgi:hypothetical protein
MRILGLCAISTTLAFSTIALAEEVERIDPFDGQRTHGIIRYAKLPPPRIDKAPPLPGPIEPSAIAAASAGSVDVKGPIAMSTAGLRGGYGSALVSPRGGSMSTPRQRANREIRKMIRLID